MDFKQVAAQLRKPEGDFGRKLGENMNRGNKLMNEAAIKLMDIAAGDTVLEIGMGNGFFSKDVVSASNAVTYTGCDFSETMVEEATRLNQELVDAGKAGFVLASANQLPFPDGAFSKVFTINTLYFWENAGEVLAGISRVLKPAGQLLIGFRPPEIMEKLPFVQYGFRVYSIDAVANLLVANGFTVLKIHEIDEPDQEFNGTVLKMASVMIRSVKNG